MLAPTRTVLYIMSPSFSGSTLLTTILANHPGIATVGELKASKLDDIATYRCSCGELLLQCPFWSAIAEELGKVGTPFSLEHFGTHFTSNNPAIRKVLKPLVRTRAWEHLRSLGLAMVPGARATLNDILSANQRIIEAVCRHKKAEIFLDGSKDPLRAKYFYESKRWNLKIVYLTRDGRGAANSYNKYSKNGITEAASEWKLKIHEMDNLLNYVRPEDFIRIKYEDLCRLPDATLATLYEFVGLQAVEQHNIEPAKQHILGNDNMRFGSVKTIRLDEKWRTDLSQQEIAEFNKIAENENEMLGYL